LGIFVSSDRHLHHVIALTRAAKNQGIKVTIFFTHLGLLLTQDPRFAQLKGIAEMSICNVGLQAHGIKPPVAGIRERDHATQSRHAELIKECDRYVVF